MTKAVGALGAFIALLFGLIYFLKDLRNNAINKKIFFIGIPFALIFLLAGLGMLYGKADWTQKIDYFLKSLRYPAIFFGAYLIYRLNLKYVALQSFSVSMAVTLGMVYASTVVTLPWAPQVPQMWGGDHTIWGDYITQNIMVSFFAVWMLHRAVQSSLISRKLGYGVFSVLAGIAVMALSYGRTGYVMLSAALLTYCFFCFKDWRWRVAACAAAMVILVALYFGVDAFQSRIDQGYLEFVKADGQNSLTSIGARLLMWSTAWTIGWDSMWWGVGSGSYAIEWCSILKDKAWCEVGQHPHNHFLLLFASNGIFALAAYVFIFLAACWMIYKRLTSDCELMVIFLVILLVDSLLNGPFWNIREANFFTLMAAPVLAAVFEKMNSHK